MGKTVEDICNLLIVNSRNKSAVSKDVLTLNRAVCELTDGRIDGYSGFYYRENPYDIKTQRLMQELAIAIDGNSVERIKYLKKHYGHLEEFKSAKKYLNQKCKEVWSIYKPLKNVPKEAMKCLGITNKPELSFLLDTSLKNYEQDGSDITSCIISNILKNKNMDYTIEEIHHYLANKHKNEQVEYNLKTVEYLIRTHNYDKCKLKEIGAFGDILNKLNYKDKFKLIVNSLKSKFSYHKI